MSSRSESAISELAEKLAAASPPSATEKLPADVLGGLLGGALEGDDPTARDYGDRYAYRATIGEGGQGIVLAAHDNILDREVALKALKKHGAIREEYLEREARLSGILEHPNIPPTYDLGHDETGAPFFVMRKVEGFSLDEVMRRSRREKEPRGRSGRARKTAYSRMRLLNIFVQVCHAIEYAHSRGILHLDIKPQNVKLGPYGEVFVLDWGFAARKDEPIKVMGGTPIYIAPERLRHEQPDERADVYSLGVLLYRLLTGERPYDVRDLSFEDYRKRFETLTPIPPRERDPSVPRELDAIVMKAIAKERGDRYPSAHELAADLQRFVDGVPVTAFREGPVRRAWKTMRRHSVVSALLAALVLVLAAAGGMAWRNHRLEIERSRQALRQAEEAAARQRAKAARKAATVPFQKGREFMEKAQRVADRETARPELETARAFFSKAISRDPAFDEAFFERGKAHMRLGAMNEALADFRQALSLNENRIMAHYYSGAIYMDVFKNPRAAEREFAAMQRIDEGNEYSNLGLARLHILAGEYRRALNLCSEIETRNPSLREVWDLRGLIYCKGDSPLRDPQRALAAYNEYLATPSHRASAYENRGTIRWELGDGEGALADYDAALALNPNYIYALNNRGYVRYKLKGDLEGAFADFDRALTVDPEYHQTYLNRGAVREFQGEWALAEREYNWAYDLIFRQMARTDATVLLRMGQCFFRQGRFAEAEDAFDRALRYAGQSRRATLRHRRGLARFALDRYDDALSDFAAARAGGLDRPFYAAMMEHLCLYRLGQSSDPTALQPLADQEADKPWLADVVRYWRGLITAADAVRAAETPEARCEAHYYTGMARLLLEEDPAGAAQSFRAVLASDWHLYNEYALARRELEPLDGPADAPTEAAAPAAPARPKAEEE